MAATVRYKRGMTTATPQIEPILISSFYRFTPLSEAALERGLQQLETMATNTGLRGLILMGPEGINATVSGTALAIEACKSLVADWLTIGDLVFKDSVGAKHPFQIFRIKIRDEIVTLGRPGLVPDSRQNQHLSPERWHKAIQQPGAVILDTRNRYEVEIGKFKSAIDLGIDEFSEFPEKLAASGLSKDAPVYMYCTGGIRCEKAMVHMQEQGYTNLNQLDGGILSYLKEFPEGEFAGECFVFDYRVAVDARLAPTRQYRLCPHCGQPAKTPVSCIQCGRAEQICSTCHTQGQRACSKNCAHHASIGSSSSKAHLPELRKRNRG